MNLKRFKAILTQIKDHPETWNQTEYHTMCGTAHCIAGWAQIHAKTYPAEFVKDEGIKWLELEYRQAEWLFDPYRTMLDFEHVVKAGDCPEMNHDYDEEYPDEEPEILYPKNWQGET